MKKTDNIYIQQYKLLFEHFAKNFKNFHFNQSYMEHQFLLVSACEYNSTNFLHYFNIP